MPIDHIKVGGTSHEINDARSVVVSSAVTSIVFCTDEATYNSITPKVNTTLYLIGESS